MNKQKPFNGLFDVDPDMKFTTNERAKEIVGERRFDVISIDQPPELGYHCPVCKYEPIIDGNYDERLTWSQYNGFLFCFICNKDYPSVLCMPDLDRATDIYLNIVEEIKRLNERPEIKS